jgi:hypothetical protein
MFTWRSRLCSQSKADQKANSPLKSMVPMTSLRNNLRRTHADVHADADVDLIATIGFQQNKLP